MEFNLQRFADAQGKTGVQGKQLILLMRVYGETAAATLLALEKEHSLSISKDASSTATKEGNLRVPGQAEVEISASSVLPVGDASTKALRAAMNSDKLIELWRANLAEKGEAEKTYKGTYFQGYLTSYEESAPADGQVDVSLTFGINGIGVDGDVTVPDELVEEALYAFKDSTAVSGI